MSYDTTFKLYYVPEGELPGIGNRFIPAPLISIQPELLYVNDIVIGYNYIVTLNGYATALNLETYAGGDLNFTNTIEAVEYIRNLLLQNNNKLIGIDNTGEVIVAKNGLLQSLNFEETENNWFNYAKYTATLSFNNIFLSNCENITTLDCLTLPSGIDQNNSPYLMDMQKYKIKSVKDNWTINLDNIHKSNTTIGIYNEFIDITYNIEANGKSFISSSGNTKSAWEQAKSYCIDRLKQEITRINTFDIGPLVSSNHISLCSSGIAVSEISNKRNISLLYQLNNNEYTIYNETVNCSTSEADGSFSLEYKSIIKHNHSGIFNNTHCIHDINITENTTDDGSKKNKTITVTGNIQGLIRGGLLNGFDTLTIPNNGSLLQASGQLENKYRNAIDTYNQIQTGNPAELTSSFIVDNLNITRASLDPYAPNPTFKPIRKLHTVAHNYNDGTINYTEEYNNTNMSIANEDVKLNNISVNVEDSIPLTAEFIIPGRSDGPITQILANSSTSKKITISMDGNITPSCSINLDGFCDGIILPSGVPSSGLTNYEITDNKFNLNYNDGSFTLNRSYIYIG